MKWFDSRWERISVNVSSVNVRVALVALGVVAMVLGGSADAIWN